MAAITREDHRRLYQRVGQRIRETRTSVGLTQAKLADVVSLTRTSITNIEKGRQKIFVHTLFDIAAALQTEPSALLPESERGETRMEVAKVPGDLSKRDRVLIESAIKTTIKGR